MNLPPFHLALPVHDLNKARTFYVEILGCSLGREDKRWIDFNFLGHQLSVHLKEEENLEVKTNPVDGVNVPVRHFGAILDWERWHRFKDELREKGVCFLIEPKIRFQGEPGEQATFFIEDPSGNALEFKAFRDPQKRFETSRPNR